MATGVPYAWVSGHEAYEDTPYVSEYTVFGSQVTKIVPVVIGFLKNQTQGVFGTMVKTLYRTATSHVRVRSSRFDRGLHF